MACIFTKNNIVTINILRVVPFNANSPSCNSNLKFWVIRSIANNNNFLSIDFDLIRNPFFKVVIEYMINKPFICGWT